MDKNTGMIPGFYPSEANMKKCMNDGKQPEGCHVTPGRLNQCTHQWNASWSSIPPSAMLANIVQVEALLGPGVCRGPDI